MLTAYASLAKSQQADDGTIRIAGVVRSEGKGERIAVSAIKKALPGFMRHGSGALRDGPNAAGRVDEVIVDEEAGEALVKATIVDAATIAKFQSGFFKGIRLDGKITARDGEVVTAFDWNLASLVPNATNRDFEVSLAKAEVAASLGQDAITGDSMDAVSQLSAQDLERYVASLSGENRAMLLIRMMYGAGRKVKA